MYLYFSTGNGQPREPTLCQLYRHTFVPCLLLSARGACRRYRSIADTLRRLLQLLICCPQGAQQQTRPQAAAAVDRWDRQTDGRTLDRYRPCSAYYADSVYKCRQKCHYWRSHRSLQQTLVDCGNGSARWFRLAASCLYLQLPTHVCISAAVGHFVPVTLNFDYDLDLWILVIQMNQDAASNCRLVACCILHDVCSICISFSALRLDWNVTSNNRRIGCMHVSHCARYFVFFHLISSFIL